jgi:lipid-A-disaccharide synthase
MTKVFISTGEPSGDLYGSLITKELLTIDKNFEISGIGSNQMQKSGVNLIKNSDELTTFGFYEGIKNYSRLRKIYQEVLSYLDSFRPDIFLPISFGGFNIRLARAMKKLNTKVVYFAPPQLWAWGKWRAKELRQNTDKVICLFPFEEKFFQDLGINAIYLGNPLLDYVKTECDSPATSLGPIPSETKIITFMPGSRKEEIANHLPLMLEIFQRLKHDISNIYGFAITDENKSLPHIENLFYTIEEKYQIMAKSDLIVLGSGTASLEASILEVPHIAIYRLSFASYLLARSLVKIKRFALANIILQEDIVPEYIQPTFTKIYPSIIEMLSNPNTSMREQLSKIWSILGPSGAIQRISQAILS